MVTVFTWGFRTEGGDLLFTYEKQREGLPIIPDGTVISIEGHEFSARGYLELHANEYHVLLGSNCKWDEAGARRLAESLEAKGWQCVWRRQISGVTSA